MDLIKGLGKGRGLLWKRRDASSEPAILKIWIATARALFVRLQGLLKVADGSSVEALEQEFEEALKFLKPPVAFRPFVARSPDVVFRPRVVHEVRVSRG